MMGEGILFEGSHVSFFRPRVAGWLDPETGSEVFGIKANQGIPRLPPAHLDSEIPNPITLFLSG